MLIPVQYSNLSVSVSTSFSFCLFDYYTLNNCYHELNTVNLT